MSEARRELENYPDISFIGNMTLEDLKDQMIQDYKDGYRLQTGREIELSEADPYRMILYAAALNIYQGYQYLDNAGKQSFLKYAYGDFLENLAAFKGIERKPGCKAYVKMRFTASEQIASVITIPMGTRVTPGDNVFFYTTEVAEIKPGNDYVDVMAECTEIGELGNKYKVGKINSMVDTVPFIGSVANVTESEGGAEEESDDQFKDRVFLAPSSYSTAGPDDAYKYWMKTFNSEITDVKVNSPSDGVVEICFILNNGEIPGEAMLTEADEYMTNRKIRPLTDKVVIKAPTVQYYDINFTYYIAESDKNKIQTIKQNVNEAIDAYKMWQGEKIGRDINPSKLAQLIMKAGAKREIITKPEFTKVEEYSIAFCNSLTVTYGGVESD